MPPRRVLGADNFASREKAVWLWRNPSSIEPQFPSPRERVFQVTTAVGPRWILGSNAKLHSVSGDTIWALAPLLRELVPLLHIVGVAEIAGDLVWLIDPTRFYPQPAGVNNTAAMAV
jgi:hypothetical protein